MRIPPWPKIQMGNQLRVRSGLDMTLNILKELGNPHLDIPPVIHVAGTNGKGSTVAFLKTIYEQAGYKVHTYTSPHLYEFNERVYLAGRHITDQHIYELIQTVSYVCEKLKYEPTFFEATTVMAFLAFRDIKADILILETGMGGRLDCTNVVPHPALTLITPISYDHMEYLGNSIPEISFEKAGIMKQGAPCVISMQFKEGYDTLFEIARSNKIDHIAYEYDFMIKKEDQHFTYLYKDINLQLPAPSLIGDHQLINASAVITSILILNKKFPTTITDIRNGLINTKWPGRIEIIDHNISSKLLPKTAFLILDGAHNVSGAISLANWLSYRKNKLIIILGMTKKRDPLQFLLPFKGLNIEGYTVTVQSEPLSYESSELSKIANDSGISFIHSYNIENAFETICQKHLNEEIDVVVTGSLFLIADCYNLFRHANPK